VVRAAGAEQFTELLASAGEFLLAEGLGKAVGFFG